MSPSRVLSELRSLGVSVESAGGGSITLISDYGHVPDEAITLAKKYKPVILEHIRPTCAPHNNPENYLDKRVGNRIRTTCRVCGRFVGYRPATDERSLSR